MITIYLVRSKNADIQAVALSQKDAEDYKKFIANCAIPEELEIIAVQIGYKEIYINE